MTRAELLRELPLFLSAQVRTAGSIDKKPPGFCKIGLRIVRGY